MPLPCMAWLLCLQIFTQTNKQLSSETVLGQGYILEMLIMMTPLQEQEEMIRRLTLYVVPVIFAIILIIGLIGNALVIGVVSTQSNLLAMVANQVWQRNVSLPGAIKLVTKHTETISTICSGVRLALLIPKLFFSFQFWTFQNYACKFLPLINQKGLNVLIIMQKKLTSMKRH